MVEQDSAPAKGRLPALMKFLAGDPNNLTLLSDAAETALHENRPDVARRVLNHYATLSPLPEKERNIAGLAAMREKDFGAAAEQFRILLETRPNAPALRFNLAWTLAMLKDLEGALNLLDPATVADLPQAAMLHVQLLHDQGSFDEATRLAKQYIERHPDHEGLLAAVSVLALDMEETELAEACAIRAKSQPDALVTLGTLALGDARHDQALDLFARALERNSRSPRAWVGQGLAELSKGSPAKAASDIEHGADLFGEHVGSWLAAGWAHLMASNLPRARTCFDKAMTLDRNFAEAHGSLAVVELMEGKQEAARRSAQTAMKLDAKSFSGALAHALLLQSEGNADLAREIVDRAFNTPLDSSGRTLAKALALHGLSH